MSSNRIGESTKRPWRQTIKLLTRGHPCKISIMDLYMEKGLGTSGLVTAGGLQMGVSHIGLSTPQHRMLWDRWLPNILHVSKPHMLYSWELPYSHKRCRSQQESLSVSAVLSGEGSTTITSYSINLGRALCQLKVEGAIILAQTEVASYWPSMCYCCMQESRYNVKIYIQADKIHVQTDTHIGIKRVLSKVSEGKISHNT